MILQNIEQHEGVREGANNIKNVIYADETVLITDLEEKLQNIFTTVTIKSETKDPNWMQRRLSAWSSQNSQCNILCKGEGI